MLSEGNELCERPTRRRTNSVVDTCQRVRHWGWSVSSYHMSLSSFASCPIRPNSQETLSTGFHWLALHLTRL